MNLCMKRFHFFKQCETMHIYTWREWEAYSSSLWQLLLCVVAPVGKVECTRTQFKHFTAFDFFWKSFALCCVSLELHFSISLKKNVHIYKYATKQDKRVHFFLLLLLLLPRLDIIASYRYVHTIWLFLYHRNLWLCNWPQTLLVEINIKSEKKKQKLWQS